MYRTSIFSLAAPRAALISLAAAVILLAAALALAGAVLPGTDAHAQSDPGGSYVLGLYADEQGSSRQIELGKDDEGFAAWFGVASDSIKVFSACSFGLVLPEGITLDGAIRWRPIHLLTEEGLVLEDGITVSFRNDCQMQDRLAPKMLAKIRFKANPEFRSGEVVIKGHRRYHLAVELCAGEFTKVDAQPMNLSVSRKLGFWDRFKEMFR